MFNKTSNEFNKASNEIGKLINVNGKIYFVDNYQIHQNTAYYVLRHIDKRNYEIIIWTEKNLDYIDITKAKVQVNVFNKKGEKKGVGIISAMDCNSGKSEITYSITNEDDHTQPWHNCLASQLECICITKRINEDQHDDRCLPQCDEAPCCVPGLF